MSYNGQMNFGLLGDYDALPDIDLIGHSIREELSGLLELAREQDSPDPRGNGGRAAQDTAANRA
jgi:hypothetical protein